MLVEVCEIFHILSSELDYFEYATEYCIGSQRNKKNITMYNLKHLSAVAAVTVLTIGVGLATPSLARGVTRDSSWTIYKNNGTVKTITKSSHTTTDGKTKTTKTVTKTKG